MLCIILYYEKTELKLDHQKKFPSTRLAKNKINSKEADESQKCVEFQTDHKDCCSPSLLQQISHDITHIGIPVYFFFTEKQVQGVHPIKLADFFFLDSKTS